jgi:demethylmenaquinone methyltransferase/2-methoxy-6-polyprenyl-1,4-benzoquinol methylase
MSPEDGLVREQIDYYDRRATEYDATSNPEGDALESQGLRLEEALRDFRPEGRVLEVACGTGTWTRRLISYADELTAVDSSADMIRLARAKVGETKVRFIEADIFSWHPGQTYDVVFFANWLSHVPASRFEAFWLLISGCLGERGRVFFIDESHDAWRKEEFLQENLVLRRLRDGSTHRVIKFFWEPSELEERLRALGWDVRVESTGDFLWGECTLPAG